MKDATEIILLSQLQSQEIALFLEQQIEKQLSISDQLVSGEVEK